jgi:hypothetical protein
MPVLGNGPHARHDSDVCRPLKSEGLSVVDGLGREPHPLATDVDLAFLAVEDSFGHRGMIRDATVEPTLDIGRQRGTINRHGYQSPIGYYLNVLRRRLEALAPLHTIGVSALATTRRPQTKAAATRTHADGHLPTKANELAHIRRCSA